jgi:uncharacterized protein (UPF0332 family)/predicted nucleotidyltransferase
MRKEELDSIVKNFATDLVRCVNGVVKVIAYGSYVEGEYVSGESDVDLLVIFRDKDALKRMKRANDLWLKGALKGVIFEIMPIDLAEYMMLREIGSPFLLEVEDRGVVLFDGGIEEEYTRRLLEKAERWIKSAEDEFQKKNFDFSTIKAYTAVELLIKAFLMLKGFTNRIKTHGGRIQKFSELYVLTGEFPKEVAGKLSQCLSARSRSMYELVEIAEQEAKSTLEVANFMVSWLRKKVT